MRRIPVTPTLKEAQIELLQKRFTVRDIKYRCLNGLCEDIRKRFGMVII
jgi:hypothetical protein